MHRCYNILMPNARIKTSSRMSCDTKRLLTSLSNQRLQVIASYDLDGVSFPISLHTNFKATYANTKLRYSTSSMQHNNVGTSSCNHDNPRYSFIHCQTLGSGKYILNARKFSSSPAEKTQAPNEKSILPGDPPSDTSFSYAIVNHSEAYEEAMSGRHGKQLSLAYNEGLGADDEDEDEKFFLNFDEPEEDEEIDEDVDDDNDAEDMEDDEKNDREEDAENENERIYNNDGSLATYSKSELIAMKSGAPAGGAFAIIQLRGFQHKIAVHDLIITNKLKPTNLWKVGQTLTIKGSGIVEAVDTLTHDHDDDDNNDEYEDSENENEKDIGEILLVGSPEKTYVGLPAVKDAEVDVMVEEITRDKTVIVFKKKRRKNYRRKNGFRREVTFLRVLDIRMPSDK